MRAPASPLRTSPIPRSSCAGAAVARTRCAAAVSGGVKAEVRGAGGARLGCSEVGCGAVRGGLLRLRWCRRDRLRRGSGGAGGLDQGVRVRAAGGGVAAEARVARRRRRVRARGIAGDRAPGGDPGRVLDAAPSRPPHRPIHSRWNTDLKLKNTQDGGARV